ncbi:MAG: hypothetical protein LBL00_07885 [Endomicrobium sp.]|jgi:predicted amino acid-binding ACT domain protein|nr:hypothetical protein [Endomicrobium sp.]
MKEKIYTVITSVVLAAIFSFTGAYIQIQRQQKDIDYVREDVKELKRGAAVSVSMQSEIRERLIAIETKLDIMASKK